MHKGRRTADCLYQIGFQCVFQQNRHSVLRHKVARKHGFAVKIVGNQNIAQTTLQVDNVFRKGQHRHHFASRRNVEFFLVRHSVLYVVIDHHSTQSTIVYVQATIEHNSVYVDTQRIALKHTVVNHCRK